MDMLVLQTHDLQERLDKKVGRRRDEQLRYTDTHFLQRERGLSIKCAPMSLVLQGTGTTPVRSTSCVNGSIERQQIFTII